MNAKLERQGQWVLISMDESPESVLGLWETVAEEVKEVTIKKTPSAIKVHGPVNHALWAVYLWFKLMLEYGPSLGQELQEEKAMHRFGALVEEIRAVRGW